LPWASLSRGLHSRYAAPVLIAALTAVTAALAAPDRPDLRVDLLATPFDWAAVLHTNDDHPDGLRRTFIQDWYSLDLEGRVASPLRLGLSVTWGRGTLEHGSAVAQTVLVPRLGLDLLRATPTDLGLSLDLQWPLRLSLASDPPQDGALGPLPWIEVSFGTTRDFASLGVSSRVWPGDGRLAWASYGTWLSPTARLVVGISAMARLTRSPDTTDALSGATVSSELDLIHAPDLPLRWLFRAELGYSVAASIGIGFDWGRRTGFGP